MDPTSKIATDQSLRKAYLVNFLGSEKTEFLQHAYIKILGRQLDKTAKESLAKYSNNISSQVEILKALHQTSEGMQRNIEIVGLKNTAKIFDKRCLASSMKKQNHQLPDFLFLAPDELIDQLFVSFLDRMPEEKEKKKYLAKTSFNFFSTITIICSIANSAESANKKTKLNHSKFWNIIAKLGKIPVLTYLVQFITNIVGAFIRLRYFPTIFQRIYEKEKNQHLLLQSLTSDCLESMVQINSIKEIAKNYQYQVSEFPKENKKLAQLMKKVETTLRILEIKNREISELKNSFAKNGHILPSPELAQSSFSLKNKGNKNLNYNDFYIAFENRFRGTELEIQEQLEVYLQFLPKKIFEPKNFQAIDLGCGRGEWLKTLEKFDIYGLGIDTNEGMIEICTQKKINCQLHEALSFLESSIENSFDLISCFHLVEHLCPDDVLDLLKQMHRTLKPGGMVIIETPNPENLTIGSCNFYLDLSHKNPIPPKTLEFCASFQGFIDVEIIRLSPVHDNYTDSRLDTFLYGPQNYSIIGRKDLHEQKNDNLNSPKEKSR